MHSCRVDSQRWSNDGKVVGEQWFNNPTMPMMQQIWKKKRPQSLTSLLEIHNFAVFPVLRTKWHGSIGILEFGIKQGLNVFQICWKRMIPVLRTKIQWHGKGTACCQETQWIHMNCPTQGSKTGHVNLLFCNKSCVHFAANCQWMGPKHIAFRALAYNSCRGPSWAFNDTNLASISGPKTHAVC